MRALTLVALIALPALAQDRPSEADLFGAPEAQVDAGAPQAASEPAVADAGAAAPRTAANDRDTAQLSGPALFDKFESKDVTTDPIKIGGSLLMTGQFGFPEGRDAALGTVNVPMVMDPFLDARPNDRVRAMAVGRLQFDPTRPLSTSSTTANSASLNSIGLTTSTATNPSVNLDQLWLRFDLLRTLYFTVGRQKVRWGTSHIWYPTDFLNSQPRDALNPFDARLGVNMVKVHLPLEKLGWNFYGYGILDNIDLNAATPSVTVERLGGALRAEFVVGPAEIGLGGVWMKGRRPRYAVDFSTPLGPIDIYGEAAIRSGKDFLLFDIPDDLTAENAISKVAQVAASAHHGDGIVVQASGGLTYQFNYTDKNTLLLSAEYFYNPVGYDRPEGYLVNAFMPSLTGMTGDPLQRAPLYQGKHSIALIATSPTVPGAEWISLTVSNIIRVNDPSGLTRLDASFRVLTYLTVTVFSQFFYGQSGGELRFALPDQAVNDLASLSPTAQQAQVRAQLKPLTYPPLVQCGALLRLSI
jgi:hypothetical protein